jgi:gluconokinase
MPVPPPSASAFRGPAEPGAACTIALDLGTTTLKAIALADADGQELAQAQAPVALRTDATGAAEQDPAAVYDAATGVVAQVARALHASGHRVARIGLSAAMHSILAVGPDDRPLTPALTWIDSRAQAQAAALWASPEGRALYARTGAPIHAMTPLLKLMWFRQHRPELLDARRFVSLKEWVWRGWFGDWRVDASIANASGLYALRDGDWDPGALALAGIRRDQLSPIVETLHIGRGLRDAKLLDAGLDPDVPVCIGASDGVLANLGVGATGSDRLVLTVGTSLAARFGSPVPATDPETRSFCYVLGPGRFIVGGPSNSGGILLDWLYHKLLMGPEPTGETLGDLVAASDVETGALTCLPYVAGERAPLWDAGARAAFIGLDLNHTRAHLMRAAIEGILFNARWIVSGLFERIGRPRDIVATGHLFDSAWVRQAAADIFGLPLRHFPDRDASLTGAIRLARIATGAAEWPDAAQDETDAAAIEPLNPDAYRPKYERFRRLAAALAEPGTGASLGS